ncbi:50S ribosomal protein L4 [Candidatus Berkelbacteria bacterium]|nr:50S ribosomal protein L4 [Candidatus Berkelbacteria bacterium]
MSPHIESRRVNERTTSSLAFPKALDIHINYNVIRQVILGVASNNHRSTAQTKTRGEVRGGGRKPWKQKGTGRARQGSSRAPHWIGGSVTFGPSTDVNYSHSLSQVMRTNALKMIFKIAYDTKHLIIVDSLPLCVKTKEALQWLSTLPIDEGHIVIIDTLSSAFSRGFKNIPYVSFQSMQSPRIDFIAHSDWIVMTRAAIDGAFPDTDKTIKKVKKTATLVETKKNVTKPSKVGI